MKMFPKTQDQTIDRLLRVQGGGSGKESQPCREFDADLANAYVERSLPTNETARYEQHLAVCSPCRKSIITLTRMAQADVVTARAETAGGRIREGSWVQRWRGALTAPQWAMAAAAAIVLAITLPLILSHRGPGSEPVVAVNGDDSSSYATNPPVRQTAQGAVPGAAANSGNDAADAAREPNAAGREAAPPSEKAAAVAETKKDTPTEPQALARNEADTASAGVDAKTTKPAESQPADQVIAKNETPAQPGAPAPAAAEAPLPKIDEKDAKRLADDQDAAKDTTLKPGHNDGDARKAETTAVRPDTIAPPPPPPSRAADSGRARRDGEAASGPAASRFQPPSREAARAPRGPSRKVGNHTFWLRGDVWTDKDYDPNKEMPVVTIIRDSDVYNDLLAKEEKIKPFLTGFTGDARVIFIFKGTVYKLIPQDSDR
jgi:Putative zinc-finger